MTMSFDRHARIVIIGGGVIGCSVAYHLARRGERDVVVLEKGLITEGCTWHAAGLVGQLRGRANLTRLMQNSVAVFDRLEEESGQKIDWKKVGSLRLASSPERWSEVRRSMTLAKSFDFECHSLSGKEAQDLFPYIDPEGVVGAAFIPSDGYVDPYALTQAFASAAKKGGVKIQERTLVKDFVKDGRRVVGVVTDNGTIGCDILVNCAGLWAKRIGEMLGVPLAAGVVEHQYFLTEKKLDLPKTLPTLRDPDKNFYLKPDVASFAIGGWEDGTKGSWRSRPPFEFGRELFQPNMDRLELFALPCAERLPILNEVGIQTIINGPIPVSADGEPILGQAPEYDNLFVACGFTAGIAASGGAGEAMANWIIDGDPGMDLWAFDVRRFGTFHANGRCLEERAVESYGSYYKIHWPHEETQAVRNVRRSPFFEQLKSGDAVFGSRFGWERANWFARKQDEKHDIPSFEEKPNWFDAVGEECAAIRNRAALIDQSSFSKFEITGLGVQEALQRIAANDLSGEPGRAVYTQLCNEQGGIEADVTFMHVDRDHFMLITGSGFGIRDSNWVRRHLPDNIQMRDVTSAFATLNICGPKSREILASATDDDVSNAGLPFFGVKWIELGHARVLAARVGYVGELGYELYIPTEYGAHVYDTLWKAGESFGIANAGYRAIESCRMEKGYLYWSTDISPEVNPYEAGLGFCVELQKADFVGKDALIRARTEGAKKRLCSFTVADFAPFHGGEAIMIDGEVVGRTTSTTYAHTLRKTIAFGYLPVEKAKETTFQIEAFGKVYSAIRGPRCMYDAAMERLKV